SSVSPSMVSGTPGESVASLPSPTSEAPGRTGPIGPAGSPPEATPSGAAPSVGASAPEPTATALAIISNVVVVGETASYSPDAADSGSTLPPGGGTSVPPVSPSATESSTGPSAARGFASASFPLLPTTSGGGQGGASESVSPLGEGTGVGGSGDLPSGAPIGSGQLAIARTFILDPISGAEMELAAPAWRPVVDPDRKSTRLNSSH